MVLRGSWDVRPGTRENHWETMISVASRVFLRRGVWDEYRSGQIRTDHDASRQITTERDISGNEGKDPTSQMQKTCAGSGVLGVEGVVKR